MVRCPCCEHDARLALPTGPLPCEYMAIGEKPGREEAYKGKVFQGMSGQEADQVYLPTGGLKRDQVYVTNVVKCRLGGNNDTPTDEQIRQCGGTHLPHEFRRCKPKVLFLLGSTACKLIPGLEIDKDHGLPFWYDSRNPPERLGPAEEFFGSWEGWVWPMYHPASGLHNTSMMIPMMEDWYNFREWTQGKWKWNPLEWYRPDIPYAEIVTDDEFEQALETVNDRGWVASDTENDGSRFWSMQFSFRPGTGFLLRDRRLILEFYRRFKGYEWRLHHAIHDLDVYQGIGVDLGKCRVRDTMVDAYEMNNLPQGLKALVWRLFGIPMQSWEDLVSQPSREAMVRWLESAVTSLEEDRTRVETRYVRPRPATMEEMGDWESRKGLILGGEVIDPPMATGRLGKNGQVRKFKQARKATIAEVLNPRGLVFEGEPRVTREVLGRFEMKPGKPEQVARRLIKHAMKPTYDLWEKAGENGITGESELSRRLRDECGSNPILSIVNAPMDRAVEYACKDADMTGRLALGLDALRSAQQYFWNTTIPSGDCDY